MKACDVAMLDCSAQAACHWSLLVIRSGLSTIKLNHGHDITGVRLEVSYRPDKSDEDGVAEVTVIENKLDEQKAK